MRQKCRNVDVSWPRVMYLRRRSVGTRIHVLAVVKRSPLQFLVTPRYSRSSRCCGWCTDAAGEAITNAGAVCAPVAEAVATGAVINAFWTRRAPPQKMVIPTHVYISNGFKYTSVAGTFAT